MGCKHGDVVGAAPVSLPRDRDVATSLHLWRDRCPEFVRLFEELEALVVGDALCVGGGEPHESCGVEERQLELYAVDAIDGRGEGVSGNKADVGGEQDGPSGAFHSGAEIFGKYAAVVVQRDQWRGEDKRRQWALGGNEDDEGQTNIARGLDERELLGVG